MSHPNPSSTSASTFIRSQGRAAHSMRPVLFERSYTLHAEGAVLVLEVSGIRAADAGPHRVHVARQLVAGAGLGRQQTAQRGVELLAVGDVGRRLERGDLPL